jgi:hypothetical protein
MRSILTGGQLGQKSSETPAQLVAGYGGAHLSSLLLQEASNRRMAVQADLDKK